MRTAAHHLAGVLHFQKGEAEFDRILSPSTCFKRPTDVVNDPDLALSEKRAILSSWASDACAVESVSFLHCRRGTSETVSFDEIMDALQLLDRPAHPSSWSHAVRS